MAFSLALSDQTSARWTWLMRWCPKGRIVSLTHPKRRQDFFLLNIGLEFLILLFNWKDRSRPQFLGSPNSS